MPKQAKKPARPAARATTKRAAKRPAKPVARKPAAPKLPAIGAAFQGGKFAGITLHDGKPMALVLLPGSFGPGKWADAIAWAAKQKGELPNRHDALVLYDNLKSEFEQNWYWTAVVPPVNADYAFFQYFGLGGQDVGRKGDDSRARAVRRVAI